MAEIRRLVVGTLIGSDRVRDRGDAYIAAAFDTLRAAPQSQNPLARHLASGLSDPSTVRQTSLADRNRFLTSAWKGDVNQGAS